MSYLGLISFLFWAFSCGPGKIQSVSKGRDTLKINDKVYFLDSISEAVFADIPGSEKSLAPDTSVVKIFADSILVKTKTKNHIFRNDTFPSELFAVYTYKNLFKDVGFIQVHCDGWESRCEFLINIETGEKTMLWGELKFSPGKEKVISYNVDLEAGFTPNGFQLFQMKDKSLSKVFDAYMEKWGPKEIKWESDTAILIKRVRYDDRGNEVYDYRRMVLK